MKRAGSILPTSILLFASALHAHSQNNSTACMASPSTLSSGTLNLFNEQQEQYLGDALAELVEQDLRVAPPAASGELTRIGQKLLAQLPPTGVQYQFRIYDSGEINAFSLAGGRVYISRKLIAAIKNEDQLAGVVAHEIGHIYTHQSAIEMSRLLRFRLGVTSVSDRQDIFAKVHQLMSTPPKLHEPVAREDKDQLVADQLSFYATVQAGYSLEAVAQFLNDVMLNRGKTGNWITDAFGITEESSQRYRSAVKVIASLPAPCRNRTPQIGEQFSAWQAKIVSDRMQLAASTVNGDHPIKLDPPLRPSLWNVKFSADGKLVLAQDETGLAVVDFSTQKVLYRIPAPNAEAARFTPDGKQIVFHDAKLRVERWDEATGKRLQAKEMVVYDGCRKSLLSSDGRTLVCLNLRQAGDSLNVDVRFIDVESGNNVFEKKGFFSTNDLLASTFIQRMEFNREVENLVDGNLGDFEVSPDGRYVLVDKHGKLLAYDFTNRQPITVSGKLKDLAQHVYAFEGPDQLFVLGERAGDAFRASTLSFPDGRASSETDIAARNIWSVSKGQLLRVGPLKNYPIGVYDPAAKKLLIVWKSRAIDVWDSEFAGESLSGGLSLGLLTGTLNDVALPIGDLPHGRAVAFSPDGKYLSFSLGTRAAIWNLETGKQERLVRPMRSVWFDNHDTLFAQTPKFNDRESEEARVDIEPFNVTLLGKYEAGQLQRRDLDFIFKPMGKDKDTRFHATLQVTKMGSPAVLWSRDYPKERPVIWPAEGDRILLGWDLHSDAAGMEIKTNPKIHEEAGALKTGKKGLLLQSVVASTGKILDEVALPEIDLTGGADDERFAALSGDTVLVRGEHGNTAIYRMDTGKKVGEFFGAPVSGDAESGIIVAVNRESEMLLVDQKTGGELQRFSLGSPILAADVVGQNPKQLLVLTANQVVHRIPLPALAVASTQP